MSAAVPSATMSGPAPAAATGPSSLVPVGDDPGHLVSKAPFDPQSAATLTAEQEHFYLASQWMLMWWKFKRHKVAVASGIILLLMYGSTLVTEILVPYNLHSRHPDFIYASPQSVHCSARCRARACSWPVRVSGPARKDSDCNPRPYMNR